MGRKRPNKGGTRTKLTARFPSDYNSWKAMRARCRYPSNSAYPNIGGKGISVCEEWDESFARFLEDMGPKPSPEHGISRLDSSRDYTPSNSYWATPHEQQANSVKAVFLEFNGERLCISDWSNRTGISASIISTRINHFGWTVEQALGIKPAIGQTPIGDAKRESTPKKPRVGRSDRKSASGIFGVCWHKRQKKWQAVLRGMGKPIHCGCHATKAEANEAIRAKARELKGETRRESDATTDRTLR